MSSTDKSLPRNMTAVGTMGEMGQLFTVYEKNWTCKDCNQENYSSRYIYIHTCFQVIIVNLLTIYLYTNNNYDIIYKYKDQDAHDVKN